MSAEEHELLSKEERRFVMEAAIRRRLFSDTHCGIIVSGLISVAYTTADHDTWYNCHVLVTDGFRTSRFMLHAN